MLIEPALAVQSGGPQAMQRASPVASTAPVDEVISAEKIEAARKATESDATPSAPLKQKAIEHFDRAPEWLREAGTEADKGISGGRARRPPRR